MRLPFLPHDGLCRRCGRNAIGHNGEFLCEDCHIYRPAFDRVASVFRFEREARELVNGFKFKEKLYLREDFVDFLEALARIHFKLEEIEAIVPMPSTIFHRWIRGFNQCEELAKPLAKRLGKPCVRLLKRIGDPKRQGGLSEVERRANVIDTFAVKNLARLPATVLLVDDIMTTGATLSEAARTLKNAGVKQVWGLTLARSVRY